MIQYWVRLSEHIGDWIYRVVERLITLGATASPNDGCECLYLKINEFVTIVFEVFA